MSNICTHVCIYIYIHTYRYAYNVQTDSIYRYMYGSPALAHVRARTGVSVCQIYALGLRPLCFLRSGKWVKVMLICRDYRSTNAQSATTPKIHPVSIDKHPSHRNARLLFGSVPRRICNTHYQGPQELCFDLSLKIHKQPRSVQQCSSSW